VVSLLLYRLGRRRACRSHQSAGDRSDFGDDAVYVSRTLTEWQELGIVETGRQKYRIVDPARLAEIAEGASQAR
jgi:hypothetical protein